MKKKPGYDDAQSRSSEVLMQTMRHVLILALFGIIVTGAHAQEHAPTLDQCRADRDLWIYQIKNSSHEEHRKSLADIKSDLLFSRQIEMTNCMTAIDPKPDTKTDWLSVNQENFTATVLANEKRVLEKEKWEGYLLLRLVYAEEIEERLMEVLKSKK
jgi:hypothetical protein